MFGFVPHPAMLWETCGDKGRTQFSAVRQWPFLLSIPLGLATGKGWIVGVGAGGEPWGCPGRLGCGSSQPCSDTAQGLITLRSPWKILYLQLPRVRRSGTHRCSEKCVGTRGWKQALKAFPATSGFRLHSLSLLASSLWMGFAPQACPGKTTPVWF